MNSKQPSRVLWIRSFLFLLLLASCQSFVIKDTALWRVDGKISVRGATPFFADVLWSHHGDAFTLFFQKQGTTFLKINGEYNGKVKLQNKKGRFMTHDFESWFLEQFHFPFPLHGFKNCLLDNTSCTNQFAHFESHIEKQGNQIKKITLKNDRIRLVFYVNVFHKI